MIDVEEATSCELLTVHSSTVRQVPLRPLVAVQGELGKVTTLKMPRPIWGAPARGGVNWSFCFSQDRSWYKKLEIVFMNEFPVLKLSPYFDFGGHKYEVKAHLFTQNANVDLSKSLQCDYNCWNVMVLDIET